MLSPEAAAEAMQSAARAMRDLADVPSQASREAALGIQRLVDLEFATGTDPYGKPWKALRPATIQRKGHARPNIDTENLWKGARVAPLPGAGVSVTFEDDYAAYVQKVRPVLPNRGLPRAWAGAIATAITNAKARWAKNAGAEVDSSDAARELAQAYDAAAE